MLFMGRISVAALAANQLVFQYFCFCMGIIMLVGYLLAYPGHLSGMGFW